MRKVCFLICTCLCLGSVAWARRPDLNAFLNRKVTTVSGLVREVRDDPAVMDRYKRHYAMTDSQVIDFMRSLHATRLNRSETFPVYSVPDAGYIKVHDQTLKSGTWVFSDSAGQPQLMMKCGNPLSRGPMTPEALNPIDVTPMNAFDLRDQNVEIVPAPIDQPDFIALYQPPLPTLVEPEYEAAMPGQLPLFPIGAAGTNLFPLLLGLAGIGTVGTIGGGGGGGGNPVPEPSAMLALAIGFGTIASRTSRLRSKSRSALR